MGEAEEEPKPKGVPKGVLADTEAVVLLLWWRRQSLWWLRMMPVLSLLPPLPPQTVMRLQALPSCLDRAGE